MVISNRELKNFIIILSAFIFSLLTVGRMPQIILIALFCTGTTFFIFKKVDKDIRTVILSLFLSAFLIQIAISFFFYNQTIATKYYGFSYKGDDYIYGDFGTIVGSLWRDGKFCSREGLAYYSLIGKEGPLHNYQLYNAFMFYLFGICAGQILLIMNCFFHAAIIIPVYFIFRDLKIRNNITVFIFCLFLFWPSTFYWSLFNFKEPIILFMLFTVFALLIKLRKQNDLINTIFLLFFVYMLYYMKQYLIAISLAIIVCFFIFWKWKPKSAVIIIFSLLFILRQLLAEPVFSNLYNILSSLPQVGFGIRNSIEFSNTAYFSGFLTYTYPRILIYFPFGVLAVLFLPFLLKPFAISHIVVNIESMVWWCLLSFMINGIWISIRTEFKKTALLIFIFFYWLTVLVLTQGNMGTLLRQKALIYYIGFIFIGLAIDRTLCKKVEKRDERDGR